MHRYWGLELQQNFSGGIQFNPFTTVVSKLLAYISTGNNFSTGVQFLCTIYFVFSLTESSHFPNISTFFLPSSSMTLFHTFPIQLDFFHILHSDFFFKFIYFERERVGKGPRENPKQLHAVSAEPDVRFELMNCEIKISDPLTS